ncbi:MAG: alpha/beta fold hydrolase [Pirellulales bacterium]
MQVTNRLIPRQVLFGNPQKATARLSPDGTWLGWLAPVDGVLNVWVAPVDDLQTGKPVTEDKRRGIRSYSWAYTSRHILYTQDKNGDENWHVYSTDVTSDKTIDLTPLESVNARINDVSDRFPEVILVGLNDRVPQLHDIYRINVVTAERELLQKNPGFAGFLADDDYQIRLAMNYTPDGGQLLLIPKADDDWSEFLRIDPADAMTTGPAGFDKTGKVLYLVDSRKRDTAALMTIDLASGTETLLAEDPRADVGGVLVHPTEKTVQAVSFDYMREEWKVLDPAIAADLDALKQVVDGEFVVTSRTQDDRLWTVAYVVDNGPVRFYLYDRPKKKAKFLFSSRDDLDQYALAKMHPVIIPARDGLPLVSYLTLPVGSDPDGDGRPDHPLPMVLDVHGGPWSRDQWGYDSRHQWLANRGYAVLSVNYRGSSGFGKKFINAANGEWAGKMHDDLLDAVDWAVRQRVADKDKVAIMGGSYGGYATLVGLTFTPKTFACGVDIVGPSSLVTLLENVPPYWMPFMPVMKDRLGDHTTDAGRKELLARSPLARVDQIERPLLIGEGANDPRVTQLEADQIVHALQEKKIPVTYVLYPDEGHGFARPANRTSFNAVVEVFLARHLGGRYEPVGDDFSGSTITVPAGADDLPGLKEALSQHGEHEGT